METARQNSPKRNHLSVSLNLLRPMKLKRQPGGRAEPDQSLNLIEELDHSGRIIYFVFFTICFLKIGRNSRSM